jgi:endonuclease III-like uncharacterized protein
MSVSYKSLYEWGKILEAEDEEIAGTILVYAAAWKKNLKSLNNLIKVLEEEIKELQEALNRGS